MRLPLVMCVMATMACGAHRPAHTAPDESQPHITWDIRAGGDGGEERRICASAEPQPRCVFAGATTASRPLTTFHLFLHPAARTAAYDGTIRLPFLEGATQRVRPISAVVQPGAEAYSSSITGLVTSTPGVYALLIDLDVKHGATRALPIRAEVQVIVK